MSKSINKTNIVKTLLDDYDHEKYEVAVKLCRIRPSEFVRQAVMNAVNQVHKANSINMTNPQKELIKFQESA